MINVFYARYFLYRVLLYFRFGRRFDSHFKRRSNSSATVHFEAFRGLGHDTTKARQ